MKEPKDSENLAFQPLHFSQNSDDSIEPPLHRSTPKADSNELETRLSFRRSRSDYNFDVLSHGDDQRSSILSAYENLMIGLHHGNEINNSIEEISRENKSPINKRVSGDKKCDKCNGVSESVIELVQQLAKELNKCQQEMESVKKENEELRKRMECNKLNGSRHDLFNEVEVWKDACNEARIEIESLKHCLSNCESEVKKLNSQKKHLSQEIHKLKKELAKEVPQKSTCLAQQKQLNYNVCTLKRLVDKQQKVMTLLEKCVLENSVSPLNVSISSGFSTLHSSISDISGMEPKIEKIHENHASQMLMPYDDSLVKLSQALMKSTQMLRVVESSKKT